MWKALMKLGPPLAKSDVLLSSEHLLHQQLRTTFVVKRRIKPFLAKQGEPPKKLKTRHYLYDLVKNTNVEKKSDIEVILTSFVEDLGNMGDKVTVRPNYAYYHLLLPGLAVYATPENEAKYKNTETTNVRHFSSPRALHVIKALSRISLSIIMNKDSPWTLQPWHVKTSFRKCGFIVPEYAITMPKREIKGPNLDLEGKEFYIIVTVNKMETVKVRCQIRHWSTDITNRLPYNEEFWKKPTELLFADDELAKVETTKID
ncbi:large ribosomal subunit protein bL9m [Tribolium castaneum]|uniref:Large ribosomal subunit protein bL9m n=1 Tax=Tribolium castaneum TaxID=7070 RepID=D6WTJ6_TRICA|nr:PREDICTED: 39S ribosomal protein L9, mitochondrial [Tribolium castaneum]EFA07188.1 39S ribosomal protein L9, mitochondrial-like Protein [Tribolium castaneum]|eukprot:XP_974928.2 PREDICTED: 39S ribosomal protein L9, mitochondrial [Tribolium castaneum]